MTPFVINKVFLLVSGPLHKRLSSLLDLVTLCHLMNHDYKILWGPHEEGCRLHLNDILVNEEILSRVVKDVSILHESSYYYNPEIPSHLILQQSQVAREHLSVSHKNVDFHEWLVIASEAEANLVPTTMNYISYKLERQKQYQLWEFDFTITGYLNAMKSEYGDNVIGLYVKNREDFVDTYYLDFIRTLNPSAKVFVGFSGELSVKERKEVIKILKDHNPPARIFQLSVQEEDSTTTFTSTSTSTSGVDNRSLDDLLTFACFVDGCKVLITEEGSMDEYMKIVVATNLTRLCVVDRKSRSSRVENCSYEQLFLMSINHISS